jgi:hypothetical protein
MKRAHLLLIVLFFTQPIFALETSSLNLRVPGGLDPEQLVFTIPHRFYGKINDHPLDNLFGIDHGANAGLAMRYRVWSGFEIEGSYAHSEKEYGVNAGYSFSLPRIMRSGIAVQYFDFKRANITERRRNFFYQALFQSEPFWNKIRINLEGGYDGYNQRFGVGFGLDAGFDVTFGPIEGMHLVAEYFPVIKPETGVTSARNSFAVGLKARTYGHHFMFFVGNNTEIGARRLMLGAPGNDLYLAFNIQRFLKF